MADNKLIFFRRKSFWLLCGLPTLTVGAYLGLVATPRYESESVVKIYSASDQPSAGGGAAAAAGGSSASPGSYVFKTFVNGNDCLSLLDIPALKSHWGGGDILSGFGSVASFFSTNNMRLWDYYRGHVTVEVDETSNTVKLNVDGYSRDFVHGLNEKVLKLAEEELKQSGVKAYRADMEMLKAKTSRDKASLASTLERMQNFQKEHGIADYDAAYQSLLNTIDTFQEARINVSSKAAASSYLAAHSQQLEALRAQVRSIDADIEASRSAVSQKMAPFYASFTELQSAIKELASVVLLDDQSLLQAEERAVQNAYYMDVIEAPVSPSDPTEPRFLKWFLITLVASYLVYAVLKPVAPQT
ncbi:lipopolysaccharide biosynthesis protein [Acetobacter malorum DSM 14337]|uniref:Lipopolysaccharide biosynthesis protein n=2 Tax=Acetobacter malorum TaxID=178901 RepID=A0ABQ0PYE8_9PROT|nr:lipopolysaccharide biosynthesis protein [Acetobacter malorum DSM 14337]